MYLNKSNRPTYSNIKTDIDNQIDIDAGMIVKKKLLKTIKRRSGELEGVYNYSLNIDFWKKKSGVCNVVLDEAHTILNSRRSMSHINIIVTDWLSLLRRILGQAKSGFGELVLISQLPTRLDIIAREMASQIRYHVCHYQKTCLKCGNYWMENSEMPEPKWFCSCGNNDIQKHNHTIEIWHFSSFRDYNLWDQMQMKTYYKHYIVRDIEKYFPLYDTLSWENMFTTL